MAASLKDQIVRLLPELAPQIDRNHTFAFAERLSEIVEKHIGSNSSEEELLKFLQKLQVGDLYLAFQCASGNNLAWEEFGKQFFPYIKRFAGRCLPSSIDGQDLADEVIAVLWERKKIGMFEGLSSIRTWLGTIISRSAVNRINRMKPVLTLMSAEYKDWEKQKIELPDTDHSTRSRIIHVVRRNLSELPEEDRILLDLYFSRGLTFREMTCLFPVSEATLSRRLKGLRTRITEELRGHLETEVGVPFSEARELLSNSPELDFDLRAILFPENRTETESKIDFERDREK